MKLRPLSLIPLRSDPLGPNPSRDCCTSGIEGEWPSVAEVLLDCWGPAAIGLLEQTRALSVQEQPVQITGKHVLPSYLHEYLMNDAV